MCTFALNYNSKKYFFLELKGKKLWFHRDSNLQPLSCKAGVVPLSHSDAAENLLLKEKHILKAPLCRRNVSKFHQNIEFKLMSNAVLYEFKLISNAFFMNL